jgi:hypothetical protein
MSTTFDHILAGDEIEITYNDQAGSERTRTIRVGGFFDTEAGNFITSADGEIVIWQKDVIQYRVEVPVRGLPNADVILWYPGEGAIETAARYGNPGNGVWYYRGERIETAQLLSQHIGNNTAYAYDARK